MPLDPRKIAHILALTQKSLTGRQQTVVFVSLVANTYIYTARLVVLRILRETRKGTLNTQGNPPKPTHDALMIVSIDTELSNVLYVADTQNATTEGVQQAKKYGLVEWQPVGMLVGGSYILIKLRKS